MSDERVLVVPRDIVFPVDTPQGFISDDVQAYLSRMQTGYTFRPRHLVENDSSLKQIIPYVVFVHASSVFLVRRSSLQSEQRLAGQHSIGIGGHINEGDAKNDNDAVESFTSVLVEGMNREIQEEVFVGGFPSPSLAGLINDDSTPVGQVHLGLVFLAHLIEPSVAVRETGLMAGSFVHVATLDRYRGTMETWSQIVVDSGCLCTDSRA